MAAVGLFVSKLILKNKPVAKIKAYQIEGQQRLYAARPRIKTVTGWQVRHTGEVFDTEDKYQEALSCAAIDRYVTNIDRARDRLNQALAKATTVAEITSIIKNNIRTLVLNNELNRFPYPHKENLKQRQRRCREMRELADAAKVLKIELTGRWSDCVSNSHHRPLAGGKTNWDRDEDLPLGYPGWRGTLEMSIAPGSSISGDYFHRTVLQTGSGSSGSLHLKYSIFMFAADFPGLSRAREDALLLANIANDRGAVNQLNNLISMDVILNPQYQVDTA